MLKSGCCQVESRTTHDQRFECGSCNGNGCCEVYEHCVSCCMHPNKVSVGDNYLVQPLICHLISQLPLLHSILSRNTEAFHPLYSSLKDQFELCLSKCRTSSQVNADIYMYTPLDSYPGSWRRAWTAWYTHTDHNCTLLTNRDSKKN